MPDQRRRAGKGAVALAAIAAAALLAGCSGARDPDSTYNTPTKFSPKEYGVRASPRLVAAGRPVPKGGGRYVVGEPYTVRGKVYRPEEGPGYVATGIASWYGPNFHGRQTANGEIYDMNALTAAHPTLPMPSYARVTNLEDGSSLVVRVNDRGPFSEGRIIDLSARAAELLGVRRKGLARVQVEYVDRARMDGRDDRMLMATYVRPGGASSGTTVARRQTPERTTLASLFTRRGATRPADRGHVVAGAPVPRVGGEPSDDVGTGDDRRLAASRGASGVAVPVDDPIGAFLLRNATLSYAAAAPRGAAHMAAASLAGGDDPGERIRLAHAAEPGELRPALTDALRRASERASGGAVGTLIQVGVFADPANAQRLAEKLGDLGEVTVTTVAAGARTLTSVRLALTDPTLAPDAVILRAAAAGAPGAYVIAR